MAEVTLREARQAAGLTQRELAAMVGVSQVGLSLWERGQASIESRKLMMLCAALSVPQGSIAPRQPLRASGKRPKCGTAAGRVTHARHGEEPCQPCRDAQNEYRNARYVPAPPRPLKPCGTDGAYKRHIARGEPVDEACRLAHSAYEAQRVERKKVAV